MPRKNHQQRIRPLALVEEPVLNRVSSSSSSSFSPSVSASSSSSSSSSLSSSFHGNNGVGGDPRPGGGSLLNSGDSNMSNNSDVLLPLPPKLATSSSFESHSQTHEMVKGRHLVAGGGSVSRIDNLNVNNGVDNDDDVVVIDNSSIQRGKDDYDNDNNDNNNSKVAKELQRELDLARKRIADLEEEAFLIKAEVACKQAEEKHGKSQLINTLENQLQFKQRELEESDQALKNERRIRLKTQEQIKQLQQQQNKKRPRPTSSNAKSSQGFERTMSLASCSSSSSSSSSSSLPSQNSSSSSNNHSKRNPHTIEKPTRKISRRDSLASCSSMISRTSSSATGNSVGALPRESKLQLPDWINSEDLVSVFRIIEPTNAIAISEGNVDRVIIDEITSRIHQVPIHSKQKKSLASKSNQEALDVLLKVLGKCYEKQKIGLENGLIGKVLIPLFERKVLSSNGLPIKDGRHFGGSLIDLLILFARNTRKPCDNGKRLLKALLRFFGSV